MLYRNFRNISKPPDTGASKGRLLLWTAFIVLFLGQSLFAAAGPREDPIKHEVRVEMVMLPVFAVDKAGKPVHDLKKEDFRLEINGQLADIAHFFGVRFEEETRVQKRVPAKQEKQVKRQAPPTVKPQRVIFIIIDSVFNSFHGYRRAKGIAEGVVKNGFEGDSFVLMENVATGGLRYLIGPEKNKKKILRLIRRMKVPTSKWDKNLFLTREWDMSADNNFYDPRNAFNSHQSLMQNMKYQDRLNYKRQIKHFGDSLRRLKYVLKTVTKPKVVYLISEGVARSAFRSDSQLMGTTGGGAAAILNDEENVSQRKEFFDTFMLDYLKEAVEAINNGGSVLYTVNPGKTGTDYNASGEMSMRLMASETGGRYFAGKKTETILEQIKVSTSGYYEMAFAHMPEMGGNLDIKLSCNKPGIIVHTFNKTEKGMPYRWMEPVQKKMFALNMVTGGSWSRILGKVVRVKYKKVDEKDNGANRETLINVHLPKKMKDKELDIYLISYDPQKNRTEIATVTRREKETTQLLLKSKKDRKRFFVIIEPKNVYSIYNEII